MSYLPAQSIQQRAAGVGLVMIVDASCGFCAECASGVRLNCTVPDALGGLCGPAVPSAAAAGLTRALLTAAALATIAPEADSTPIAAIGRNAEAVATFARRAAGTEVISAPDSRDPALRRRLADAHVTTRPRIALSASSLRSAVRLARRGGFAAAPGDVSDLPSVTEVVQREVTLAQAHSVRDLLQTLSPEDWADAAAAVLAQQ